MVEPAEVDQGKTCGCICPGCKQPVSARKGSKRRAHFAHLSGAICAIGLETAIHRAAKQVIEEEKRLWIPAVIAFPLYPQNMNGIRAAPAQTIQVERVDIETSIGEIRPDLIAWRGTHSLAIEIEVTNPVSETKEDTYEKLRVSALAIDLKKIARSMSFPALREVLLRPSRSARWIHNEFARSLDSKFRTEAVTRPLTWRTSHKHIGKIPHVDSCPIALRRSQSATFANAKLDCPSCAYHAEPFERRKIYSVRCAGHLAERYPEAIHSDWLPDIAELETET